MDILQTPENTAEVTQTVTLPSNDLSEAIAILIAIQDGQTLQQAATALGLSPSTAYRRLKLIEEDQDTGVVKLLQANGLKLVDDWMRASSKAADKGDHRPAKDALLHAKAIEPVNDGSQGRTNIAIMIGTPEQPITIQPPHQVIESQ